MAGDMTCDFYCELLSHLERDRDEDIPHHRWGQRGFEGGSGLTWLSFMLLESMSFSIFVDHQLTDTLNVGTAWRILSFITS